MTEPLPSVVALGTQALAVPAITVAGVSLGLRADVLLAGFSGAVAAMALLNTVPTGGDTLRELARTSLKRVGVASASAMFAGYVTPLALLIRDFPDAVALSVAFGLGAGAMRLLPKLINLLGQTQRPTGGGE